MLDVRPTLIQDSGRVQLQLRLQVSRPVSLYTFYPIGGSGPNEGTVAWDPNKQRFLRKAPLGPVAQTKSFRPGAAELPTVDVAHVETTLVCPLGGTAAFTLQDPESDGNARRDLLVLVKPKEVRLEAPKAPKN